MGIVFIKWSEQDGGFISVNSCTRFYGKESGVISELMNVFKNVLYSQ